MATKRGRAQKAKGSKRSKKLNRAKNMKAVKPLTEYLKIGMNDCYISGY